MKKSTVSVYWSRLDHPLPFDLLEASFASARLHRQFRAYRTEFQQSLSLLGKLLLAYGLDDLRLRHRQARLRVEYYSNGKPYLERPPVLFSLSHSEKLVACAIAPEHPVGLDVQQERPLRAGSERVFLTSEELHLCPEASILELWSQKEAAYKAVSQQASARMTEFRFVEPGLLRQGAWLIQTQRIDLESGYVAYVALPAGVGDSCNVRFVATDELFTLYRPHGEGVCL